jgi:hypothetical protein
MVQGDMATQITDRALGSILIEPEMHGDPASPFRLFVNHRLLAEGLTAANVLTMVGDVLQRFSVSDAPQTVAIENLNASNDE